MTLFSLFSEGYKMLTDADGLKITNHKILSVTCN